MCAPSAPALAPERFDEAPRPVVHVARRDALAKRAHSQPALLLRHPERVREYVGHRLDVVRIDLQRLAHLGGGAGELAEDEHAVLVGAGRDELLGHEVHPVA